MAALLNALAILIGVVWVIWEAAQRFQTPQEVPGLTILVVALVGIGINTASALLFMRAQKDDLNAKGAFLHMAPDAAVSGAVVLAVIGIMVTGWTWLNAGVALAVSLLIAFTATGLNREALHLSLDGVPDRIDPEEVASRLHTQDGVIDLHDLHIWPISSTRTALAVHIVSHAADYEQVSATLTAWLRDNFDISHITIQIEGDNCGQHYP